MWPRKVRHGCREIFLAPHTWGRPDFWAPRLLRRTFQNRWLVNFLGPKPCRPPTFWAPRLCAARSKIGGSRTFWAPRLFGPPDFWAPRLLDCELQNPDFWAPRLLGPQTFGSPDFESKDPKQLFFKCVLCVPYCAYLTARA